MAKIDPKVIEAAQASERKYGIPASISLAQFGLESAWGKRMPPDSFNPFGIKAVGDQPAVKVRTREVDKFGRSYYINAPFRKFKDFTEAFDQHGKLLGTRPQYAKARKCLPDIEAFAHALTGVYATDPKYGEMLCTIMRQSKLYQYNRGTAPVKPELVLVPVVEPVDTVDETAEANRAALEAMPPAGKTVTATPAAITTVIVEPNTTATAVKKALSGWQGNAAGAAAIVGGLMVDPNFSAMLGRVTTAFATGTGRTGAVLSILGAALIAYRARAS